MNIRRPGIVAVVLVVSSLSMAGHAQEKQAKKPTPTLPLMAVVPPTVPVAEDGDALADPAEIMTQVIPRVAKDAEKKKWPFRILPPGTIEGIYNAVTGSPYKPNEAVRFSALKALSEKAGCRYLLVFNVSKLVGRYKEEDANGSRITAHAGVDVLVYDHDEDSYIWKDGHWAETDHPHDLSGNVNLRREKDGALNYALTTALEPFAKGRRMVVEIPKPNVFVTVQRILADGKRVLLDAGGSQHISVGTVFQSAESDAQIKVTEVLDNGSIAEIISGRPKEKEVFKPKP